MSQVELQTYNEDKKITNVEKWGMSQEAIGVRGVCRKSNFRQWGELVKSRAVLKILF